MAFTKEEVIKWLKRMRARARALFTSSWFLLRLGILMLSTALFTLHALSAPPQALAWPGAQLVDLLLVPGTAGATALLSLTLVMAAVFGNPCWAHLWLTWDLALLLLWAILLCVRVIMAAMKLEQGSFGDDGPFRQSERRRDSANVVEETVQLVLTVAATACLVMAIAMDGVAACRETHRRRSRFLQEMTHWKLRRRAQRNLCRGLPRGARLSRLAVLSAAEVPRLAQVSTHFSSARSRPSEHKISTNLTTQSTSSEHVVTSLEHRSVGTQTRSSFFDATPHLQTSEGTMKNWLPMHPPLPASFAQVSRGSEIPTQARIQEAPKEPPQHQALEPSRNSSSSLKLLSISTGCGKCVHRNSRNSQTFPKKQNDQREPPRNTKHKTRTTRTACEICYRNPLLNTTVNGRGPTVTLKGNEISRHDDTITRHDDTITRHDDTITRHDDTITRHDDTTTRYDTTARHDTITPHDDTITPHDDTITPHDDTITPHDDTITPHDDTITPHDDTITPHDDTITPHDDTITPHDDTITPHDDTITAHDDTITAHDDTITPHDDTITRHDTVTPQGDIIIRPDDIITPRDISEDHPPSPFIPSSSTTKINKQIPSGGVRIKGVCGKCVKILPPRMDILEKPLSTNHTNPFASQDFSTQPILPKCDLTEAPKEHGENKYAIMPAQPENALSSPLKQRLSSPPPKSRHTYSLPNDNQSANTAVKMSICGKCSHAKTKKNYQDHKSPSSS